MKFIILALIVLFLINFCCYLHLGLWWMTNRIEKRHFLLVKFKCYLEESTGAYIFDDLDCFRFTTRSYLESHYVEVSQLVEIYYKGYKEWDLTPVDKFGNVDKSFFIKARKKPAFNSEKNKPFFSLSKKNITKMQTIYYSFRKMALDY